MKENVGTLDAYLRISMGLMMLSHGVKKQSISQIALGSSKVAEGITRFCPMLYLMNTNTMNIGNPQPKNALKNKPIFNNL